MNLMSIAECNVCVSVQNMTLYDRNKDVGAEVHRRGLTQVEDKVYLCI